MSHPIHTRMRGSFVSNDDLQKMLLKEAVDAQRLGEYETSRFLRDLVDKLERFKD